MQDKKIKLIPGWMRPVSFYGGHAGVELWKSEFKVEDRIDAEYIVGFSIGANAALINWEKNRSSKLILINPLLPKRNFLRWFLMWLKFAMTEGVRAREAVSLKYLVSGISKAIKILKVDPMSIIDQIPEGDLIILRGSNDKALFREKDANYIRALGTDVEEVEGCGHDWDSRFNNSINEVIG